MLDVFPRTAAALAEADATRAHLGWQLAIWHRGAVLDEAAAGQARWGVPMTPASLVPWHSGTKLVTAAAVMQLIDRGRIALDDPVARHLDGFAAGGKSDVTVRHVLTHTGGFRTPAGADDFYGRSLSAGEIPAAVLAAPLEPGWAPGERAGYHPVTGFDALGMLVTAVDGRAFDAYAAEEIFEPLGMADSWVCLTAARVEAYGDRLAYMHDTTEAEPIALARYTRPGGGWSVCQPSGSAIGPAGDLVRLDEALRRGGELDGERILSPESAQDMVSRHRAGMTDETFGHVIDWGLGVMLNSYHHRRMETPYGYSPHASPDTFGHGGVQSSLTFADPEHELSVALVFNGMPGEPANHRRTQRVVAAIYEDLGIAAV